MHGIPAMDGKVVTFSYSVHENPVPILTKTVAKTSWNSTDASNYGTLPSPPIPSLICFGFILRILLYHFFLFIDNGFD